MISPLELLFILGLVFLLIIFFSPQRIVKLARSLGELRREMKRGEKEEQEE
jgi:Sec-independent protein translocase protein TatA